MTELLGSARLGNVKEIQVGRDAKDGRLQEVDGNQQIQPLSLTLWVQEHSQGKGEEPEAPEQIAEPLEADRGWEEFAPDHQTEIHESNRERGCSQSPKRARQARGASRSPTAMEDCQSGQGELNQIRQDRTRRSCSEQGDYSAVRQQQAGGKNYGRAGSGETRHYLHLSVIEYRTSSLGFHLSPVLPGMSTIRPEDCGVSCRVYPGF